MGKITVKHYLNKRVKPLIGFDDNKKRWPVYIQITQNRKTTQIRSFTNAALTEEEFETFLETGKTPLSEFISDPFYKTSLQKEVNRVINILVSYLSGKWRYVDPSVNIVVERGEYFLKPAKYMLITLCWDYIYCKAKTIKIGREKEQIYKCFNQEIDLLQNIKLLKKYYSVDISDKIPKEDYVIWHDLKLLISHLDADESLIDFVIRDNEKLIDSIPGIKDKKRFKKDITCIIENYRFGM